MKALTIEEKTERDILLTLPMALEAMFIVAYGALNHIVDDYAGEECPFCRNHTDNYMESIEHDDDCEIVRMSNKLESLGFCYDDYATYVVRKD